ncbi:MAG: hypothetical protein KBC64_06910 [Simkaniaceae bacterium]|nr:hypothetical protein [Simkaniaceae bacterium]
MSQEFEKIMSFFNMSPEKKAISLKEVFSESIGFFDHFKYVLENGSPAEKRAMFEQVAELKKKLQAETDKMREVTGLSEDELKAFALNQKNFSNEEWSVIQNAKTQLDGKAKEISSIVTGKPVEEPKAPKSGSGEKRAKKWVKT